MSLPKLPPVAQIRKALINFTGLLTSLLALGLLPEPYAGWVAGAIAVLTVVTHYKVPNDQPAVVAPPVPPVAPVAAPAPAAAPVEPPVVPPVPPTPAA